MILKTQSKDNSMYFLSQNKTLVKSKANHSINDRYQQKGVTG